jgi:hypothetical protein
MAEARKQMVNAFNTGALLVNYIGHGGLRSLSSYDGGFMLTALDVDCPVGHPPSQCLNGGVSKPPVLAAMTCNVGNFADPAIETLSEALVLREGGGASAVWSSTGESLNTPAVYLDEGFFKALFEEGETTLGGAILSAVRRYADSGQSRFELDMFNLLGDPALEMEIPAP